MAEKCAGQGDYPSDGEDGDGHQPGLHYGPGHNDYYREQNTKGEVSPDIGFEDQPLISKVEVEQFEAARMLLFHHSSHLGKRLLAAVVIEMVWEIDVHVQCPRWLVPRE